MKLPLVAARRADLAHYTPARLPAEFARYETPVEGLGVGHPGKVGLLEPAFTPLAGATRITQQFQQFPWTGSFLAYLPDPLIPFRDSRFFSRISLTVDPTATAFIGETLLPGRVAYGEHHDYSLYVSQLEARSTGSRLLFADTLRFAPQQKPLHAPGRAGAAGVAGATLPVLTGGTSELPNGAGGWVRILGSNSSGVQAALHEVWNEARLALTGFPAPDRRKT
jgi:hypothetical protein